MRLKGRKVAIIGGAGQMGEWFSRFFVDRGAKVVISGLHRDRCVELSRRIRVNVAKNNPDAVKGADLVVVSVPVRSFDLVVREIAPHLHSHQYIIDITSVKLGPVRSMHRHIKRGHVLGTHPMFGPSAKKEGQNFILTPTDAEERAFARQFGAFLASCGFKVHYISPEKHDRIIANILSLTHFVGLVTASTWKRLDVEDYAELTSTSFRFLFEFVQSVLDSNPDLYAYLQMEVPGVGHAQEKLIGEARDWARITKTRNIGTFSKKMLGLRGYMAKVKERGDF